MNETDGSFCLRFGMRKEEKEKLEEENKITLENTNDKIYKKKKSPSSEI